MPVSTQEYGSVDPHDSVLALDKNGYPLFTCRSNASPFSGKQKTLLIPFISTYESRSTRVHNSSYWLASSRVLI